MHTATSRAVPIMLPRAAKGRAMDSMRHLRTMGPRSASPRHPHAFARPRCGMTTACVMPFVIGEAHTRHALGAIRSLHSPLEVRQLRGRVEALPTQRLVKTGRKAAPGHGAPRRESRWRLLEKNFAGSLYQRNISQSVRHLETGKRALDRELKFCGQLQAFAPVLLCRCCVSREPLRRAVKPQRLWKP